MCRGAHVCGQGGTFVQFCMWMGVKASAQNVDTDLSFLKCYGFLLKKSIWIELSQVLLAVLCIGLMVCNQNGFFSQTFQV